MRLITLTTLFLIPLIGLASFPVIKETTEIINQVYLTPWYNSWWAILLQIIIFPIGLIRIGIIINKKYPEKPWREKSLAEKIFILLIGVPISIIGLIILTWSIFDDGTPRM